MGEIFEVNHIKHQGSRLDLRVILARDATMRPLLRSDKTVEWRRATRGARAQMLLTELGWYIDVRFRLGDPRQTIKKGRYSGGEVLVDLG